MNNAISFVSRRTRRVCLALLAAAVLAPAAGGFPSEQASAAAAACLTLSGTATAAPLEVDAGEPVKLTYTLVPGGNYVETVQRDPLQLSMVLDRSGSMNNSDWKNPLPRIDVLKAATKQMVSQIGALKLNDAIGLIQFGDSASVMGSGLTTSYAALPGLIDGLTPAGGTNIEHGLRRAKTMLTGKAHPYAVLVTDGYATNYYDDARSKTVRDEQKSRELALSAADQLAALKIPVYGVALGNSGGSDVDHDLLAEIAARTGAKSYAASNLEELNGVFGKISDEIARPGMIKSIVIRQPLPDGFALADDSVPGAFLERVNGKNILNIPVTGIDYPYTITEKKVTIGIVQNTPGQYTLGSSTVNYNVPCGEGAMSATIPLNASIKVLGIATATDRYGNVYLGNRFGEVTRYRLGNLADPQWTITGQWTNPAYRVSALSFTDTAHAAVRANYLSPTNKTGTADWNLLPTAPSAFTAANGSKVTDALGSAIKNANWRKGPATVAATGSANQLPASTAYKNEDFRANYLIYQYRLTDASGVQLRDWTAISPLAQLTESGRNLKVEVRAATAAITGDPARLLGGSSVQTTVSLDARPPAVPVVAAAFTADYEVYSYKVSGISDLDSGIATVKLLKNGVSVDGGVTNGSTFTASHADVTAGRIKLQATDNVGWETVKTVTELPSDPTAPAIDPGDNSVPASGGALDRSFVIRVSEDESYVHSTTVSIDDRTPVTLTPASQSGRTNVYRFKLSDIVPQAAERAGWHKMIITAKNVIGKSGQADDYFLVNPGPTSGSLTTDKDYSQVFSASPVVVQASFNPLVVPEKRFTRLNGTVFVGYEVKVVSMGYAVVQSGGVPAAAQFKPLGAYRFRVDKEGGNRVYLRLVDSLGTDNLGNGATVPRVDVNIDYNQRRY